MLNSLKWAPDNVGGKGMPGEYPRRLGASPLRAKALFIMPKYVTTRNILMNVVTELFQTLYLIFDYPYKYYTFKHFEV